MKHLRLLILETEGARTIKLDGRVVAGPGGTGPVCGEFAVRREAVLAALGLGAARQPGLFDGAAP